MNLMEMLKKVFPKPNIPQKRYLALIGMVIYMAAKVYVTMTPNPVDDAYPDAARDLVVKYFANAADDPDNHEDSDNRNFGETS